MDTEKEMECGARRWVFNSTSWKPLASEFSFCLSLLPQSQQCDVTRFVKFEDQKRALISRLMQHMLVHVLVNMPYSDVTIFRTKEGKPYVANPLRNDAFPNLNFSVSHHGDYVGMASEPLCLVGLDIMVQDPQVKETPQDYIKNFLSCFTELEWENINSAGPDSAPLVDQFNRYWCMKEAYIKAVGVGLGFELQRAEFYYRDGNIWGDVAYLRLDGFERNDWCFYLHRLGNDHWACVAKGPPAAAVESFRKTLHMVNLNTATIMSSLGVQDSPFIELLIDDLIPDLKKEGLKILKGNSQDMYACIG